jgi:hypothetical protein
MTPPAVMRTRAFAVVVGLAAALLVFVLPLLIPLAAYPMNSASYSAGFNNKVAALAAAAIGGGVLLAAWMGWLAQAACAPQPERMSRRFIAGIVLTLVTFLAVVCWMVATAGTPYFFDAGYLQQQITSVAVYQRQLYTEVEFPYGPLLLYASVAVYRILAPLGGSVTTAYYVSLIAEHAIGMLALAYAMNRLPMRPMARRIAYALLCLGSITNQLGINYTLLRFALPIALLVFSVRRRGSTGRVTGLTASVLLEFAFSPEMGFATFVACCAYAIARWRQSRGEAIAAVAFPGLGAALLLSALPSYTKGLVTFGRGSYNLPVEPLPCILIFLVAALWLAPRGVGQYLHTRAPEGALLLALYGLGVGLLPAALGRCDPLHLFFNGIPLFVLSLVAISGAMGRAAGAWLLCLGLLVGWMHVVNLRLKRVEAMAVMQQMALHLPQPARIRLAHVIAHVAPTQAATLVRPPQPPQLDLRRLEELVGKSAVATPYEVDPRIVQQLERTGHFRPDYFAYLENVLTQEDEEKKIEVMNQAEWALLPGELPGGMAETPQNIGDLQGFSFHYPIRHALFLTNVLLRENIAAHWRPVADFGDLQLYRHHG